MSLLLLSAENLPAVTEYARSRYGLLRFFPVVPAVWRTFGASENVGGTWVQGASTDIDILVTGRQPATGKDLYWAPEGTRRTTHYKTFTNSRVDIRGEDERQDPDRLIMGGMEHIVVRVERYDDDRHTKVVMREIQ